MNLTQSSAYESQMRMLSLPRSITALSLLLLGVTGNVAAQAPATFPFESWNARSAALGGAGAAAAGLEFGAVNPAAIALARGAQVSRHVSPGDATDTDVSLAVGGRWGTVHLGFRRRDWGEVAKDLGLDDLNAGEQAISAGYAFALAGGRVSVGGSASRLDADYLGARSDGWALNAGAQAALGRGIRAGVTMLHAGRIEGDGERVELPTQLRGGVSWDGTLRGATVKLLGDTGVPTGGGGSDFHAGLEAGYPAGPVTVSGRAGWRSLANPYGDDSVERSWSVGGGAEFAGVRLDLAQAIGGTLGDETFLSLSMRW